jgi:hypothetical protein
MRAFAIATAGLVGSVLPAGALAQDAQTFRYDTNGRLTAVATARPTSGMFTVYNLDDADNRTRRYTGHTAVTTIPWRLPSAYSLLPTQKLTSQDGRFTLAFEQDGNVVLRFGASVLWSTATATGEGMWFRMFSGGDLILYGPSLNVVWHTNTSGVGAFLELRNDGNLVLLDSSGTTVLWQSNTCCH